MMMAVMIMSFMMMMILYNRDQYWFHLKTFGAHGSKRN